MSRPLGAVITAVFLIATAIGCWTAVAVFRADFALEENAGFSDVGSSSLQFGFDAFHNGVQRTSLSRETFKKKQAFYPARGVKADTAMPLYINAAEIDLPDFGANQVLVFGLGSSLVAWDVIDNRFLWRVEKLPGEVFAAPLLDPDVGRIYFVTSKWERNENFEITTGPFTIRHWVHSIDLRGNNHHSFELPTRKLLEHEFSEFTHDPLSFTMCKSAVGVNKAVSPHYIYFSCSMLTNPEFGIHYGNMKGSRGMFVTVGLDANHHVTEHGIRAFTPSEPTANPHSGYDSGIYNVGSGPVVLNDGSIIVATGNGPFFPEERNYGCSVLRLNGSTLQPEAKEAGGYEYYSLEDGEFNECHGANLDMGSSSVVMLRHDGRYYAAITGKDGTVKSFDPFNLPGQDRSLKHEYLLGGILHTQPALWQLPDGEIRLNVIGRANFQPRLKRESVIVNEATRSQLTNEYETLVCVGLIPTDPGPGRVPLQLYYSGPYRDDYVNFTKTDADRYVSKDPLPYRFQTSYGWIYESDQAQSPSGYSAEALYLFGDAVPHYTRSIGYFNATSSIADQYFDEQLIVEETTGYVLTDDRTGGCGSYDGDEFERIYLLSRRNEYEERAIFASFRINSDHSLTHRWTQKAPEGYQIQNMSPLVVLPLNTNATPLMVFAVTKIDSNLINSLLIVADAESGEIIDQIQFVGHPASTMPIVIGDDIVVTTKDHGMVFFADGRSSFDRISDAKLSRLFSTIRNRFGYK